MKGRSPILIQRRNQFLIKRYYFWHEIERRRYDDVLEILSSQEVFLNKEYIMLLLRENHALVKEIKSKKPSAKQLETFSFENTVNVKQLQLELCA